MHNAPMSGRMRRGRRLAVGFVRSRIADTRTWARRRIQSSKRALSRWLAVGFMRLYRARYRAADLRSRYGGGIALAVLLAVMVVTELIALRHQLALEEYFKNGQRLSDLRAVLYTLGGALL